MKRRTVLSISTLSIFTLALLFAALVASAQTYTPLYSYPQTISGNTGVAAPALFSQGPDGELYSTIQSNGTYNSGSVYKMSTTGVYTLVYSFCAEGAHCSTTGDTPYGGVTLGTDGNLYGTTLGGGACDQGVGTIFKVTPEGAWTKLWDFTASTACDGYTGLLDEGYPYYAPFQAANGDFYGVDQGVYGGTYGVFYQITTKGKLTAHPFDYSNGSNPNLPAQGTDGNFYGTTQGGGDPTCKCGVVYKATAAGKITALHTFKGYPTDGNRPIGALVQANDGDFYGTTYEGGAYNEGTVFKISASGDYTLLFSLDFVSPTLGGSYPVAGLALGTDGNLYGVTERGGINNYGTIFQVVPGGDLTFLYSFCSVACADGAFPETPLVQHTNGKFYGTASGNSLCCSVFYSFDMGLPPFTRSTANQGKVGATVDFLGQGFTSVTSVSFGGTLATTFKATSDTLLTAKVPVGALTGVVKVVTSTGTLLGSHNFKVLPTVKSISVSSGPVGTPVTVTGSGLTQASKVTFGGVKAVFTVTNDSTIATAVPTGAKTGKVAVITPGGSASSAATFTVTP